MHHLGMHFLWQPPGPSHWTKACAIEHPGGPGAVLAWNASSSTAQLDRPGGRPKRICPVDGCGFITPYLGSHLANTPTGCLRARPSIRSILLPAESLWSRKWKRTMRPMDHHHLQDHHHRHLHHHKHLHQQQHHPPLYKLILVT